MHVICTKRDNPHRLTDGRLRCDRWSFLAIGFLLSCDALHFSLDLHIPYDSSDDHPSCRQLHHHVGCSRAKVKTWDRQGKQSLGHDQTVATDQC